MPKANRIRGLFQRYYVGCGKAYFGGSLALSEPLGITSPMLCGAPSGVMAHSVYVRYSRPKRVGGARRSEEHTSELQSLRHLVCRLLREKMMVKPNTMPYSWTSTCRESEASGRAATYARSGPSWGSSFFFCATARTTRSPLFPHPPPSTS